MRTEREVRTALRIIESFCKENSSDCENCRFKKGCSQLYLNKTLGESMNYLLNISSYETVKKEKKSKGGSNTKMYTAKSNKVASKNEEGVVMDLLDVRDELINLMKYFEGIVKKSDNPSQRYHASYSAVACKEGANFITKYLKSPKKGTTVEDGTEEE